MAVGFYLEDPKHRAFELASTLTSMATYIILAKVVMDACSEIYLFVTKRRSNMQRAMFTESASATKEIEPGQTELAVFKGTTSARDFDSLADSTDSPFEAHRQQRPGSGHLSHSPLSNLTADHSRSEMTLDHTRLLPSSTAESSGAPETPLRRGSRPEIATPLAPKRRETRNLFRVLRRTPSPLTPATPTYPMHENSSSLRLHSL